MRTFILTRLNMKDEVEHVTKLIDNISNIGFSGIFLTVRYSEYGKHRNMIKDVISTYRDNFDIAIRIDIDERNRNKIKNILTSIRKNVDIISIAPDKRDLAAFVCRDRRIDVIDVTQNNFNLFSDSMLRMCRENNKVLEFNLIELLYTWRDRRVRILGKLRTVARRALRMHVKFFITASPESFYDLRNPSEIIYIGKVLGFPREYVKDSISIVPSEILKINREKRSRDFVLPGVKIVKRPERKEEE